MNKKIISVLLSLMLILSLTACGASAGKEEAYDSSYSYEVYSDTASAPLPQNAKTDLTDTAGAAEGRKIIYTANYTAETLDFDGSWESIRRECDRLGAYISSSYLYGGTDRTAASSPRYLELTVRIPQNNYSEFLEERTSFGNITTFRESTDDVTSVYVDTEARLTSLRTQEERLLALIGQAENLEELLLLEDKLSEVRYGIESAESLLKTYDDLIDFCTVNITLVEVSSVTSVNTGFGYKLKEAFVSSWADFINALQQIVIGIVSVLPMLLILSVILFFILKKIRKAGEAKRTMVPKVPENNAPKDISQGE